MQTGTWQQHGELNNLNNDGDKNLQGSMKELGHGQSLS